jgi:hypothetical protein
MCIHSDGFIFDNITPVMLMKGQRVGYIRVSSEEQNTELQQTL